MADARDLKSLGVFLVGSTPASGTIKKGRKRMTELFPVELETRIKKLEDVVNLLALKIRLLMDQKLKWTDSLQKELKTVYTLTGSDPGIEQTDSHNHNPCGTVSTDRS